MNMRVVVMALLVAGGLSGCASSWSVPYANDAMPTASPAPKCGDDTVEAVARVMTSDAVEVVEVIGDCTTVSIGTSLAPADRQAARDICAAAARVAYQGEIESVSVGGADERELASGSKGAPCV